MALVISGLVGIGDFMSGILPCRSSSSQRLLSVSICWMNIEYHRQIDAVWKFGGFNFFLIFTSSNNVKSRSASSQIKEKGKQKLWNTLLQMNLWLVIVAFLFEILTRLKCVIVWSYHFHVYVWYWVSNIFFYSTA